MPKKVPKRLWRSGILCGKANSRHFTLIACLALSFTGCPSQKVPAVSGEVPAVSVDGSPVVTADGEILQGQWVNEGHSVAVFKGIPYAAPPVGDLRWRPPAPYLPHEGMQAASHYGPACIQDPDHFLHICVQRRFQGHAFLPQGVEKCEPAGVESMARQQWLLTL